MVQRDLQLIFSMEGPEDFTMGSNSVESLQEFWPGAGSKQLPSFHAAVRKRAEKALGEFAPLVRDPQTTSHALCDYRQVMNRGGARAPAFVAFPVFSLSPAFLPAYNPTSRLVGFAACLTACSPACLCGPLPLRSCPCFLASLLDPRACFLLPFRWPELTVLG